MKYLFLLLCCFHYHTTYSQSPTPADIVQELGAKFEKGTQLSIAVIDGEETKYYGFLLQEESYVPIDNQKNIFEIGSITKIFTSTLLAQAILDKQVKAQHPLKKFLPFQLKGKPKITLEQLSNHTSGLPRLPENIFPLLTANINDPYQLYDEQLLKEYATKELSLDRKPGEAFEYSNLGAGMLGYALSKAYKTPYEQLLEELIFKPFELTHTYTRTQQVPEDLLVKGLGMDGKSVPNWGWDVLAPAGCILSSVEDLSLFAKANLEANHPTLKYQQQATFTHNEDMSLALGWLILDKDGEEYYFHNGATGGYTSSFLLNKKHQKAVVILSNVSGISTQTATIDKIAFSILKATL